MAVSAQLSISGSKTGQETGSGAIGPLTITNTSSTGAVTQLAATVGANTVTVPSGAVGCVIKPPAGNTVTITLKGVTGDTGVGLHLTNPTVLSLASAQSTFVLTVSGTVTIEINWF